MADAKKDPAPKSSSALATMEAVTVIPRKLEKSFTKEDVDLVWVWYGAKRNCPFYNLALGGICFARELHQTRRGGDGQPDQLVPVDGNFHAIPRFRLKEIQDYVSKTVLRIGGGRAEIWDITSENYIPDALDVPAGKFIYMAIVPEGQPFDRRSDLAPSMS